MSRITSRARAFSIAFALAAIPLSARAATPLVVTGFNQDIVVENSAPGAGQNNQAFVNATMDNGTLNTGGTFYQQGTVGTTGGLPAAGTPVTSLFNPASTFVFQPYQGNNALLLAGQNAVSRTGTLTLAIPTPLTNLALFGATGNAGGATNQNDTVTVTFADLGPPVSFTVNSLAQDWFNGNQAALQVAGRFNNVVTGGIDNTGTTNPRIYEDDIDLSAFSTRPVSSITITFNATSANQNNGGYNAIVAVSGTVTPEPATLGLVAIASLPLLARRRRV
jgi:hypothetical protein